MGLITWRGPYPCEIVIAGQRYYIAQNQTITVPDSSIPEIMAGCAALWSLNSNPINEKSIFTQDATKLPRATAEEIAENNYALKLANQLNAANPKYDYKGEGVFPRFFNYKGLPYAGTGVNFRVFINTTTFTRPLYRVPASQPRVKIWRCKSGTETPLTAKEDEEKGSLQQHFNEVPMPTPSQIIAGSPNANQIWPEGTDRPVGIWCPETGEIWEMYKLSVFAAGEHKGEYMFSETGGYIPNVSTFNGIYPFVQAASGSSAAGLTWTGHSLSLEDIARVLRGGKIEHALGLQIYNTKGPNKTARLAPAVSNDSQKVTSVIPKFKAKIPANKKQLEGITSFLYCQPGMLLKAELGIGAGTYIGTINEGAKTAQLVDINGAEKLAEAEHAEAEYQLENPGALSGGDQDAVPEGAWFAWNSEFTATAAGYVRANEPLVYEIHEAIREYGIFICDTKGGSCAITMNDMRVIGSPYMEELNVMAGYAGSVPTPTKINEYVNNLVPGRFTDPTLPAIKESLEGANSIMIKIAAQAYKLEQLKPRVL